jgi:hypothetical protein
VRRALQPRWTVRQTNLTAQLGISNGLGTDSVNQGWRRQALAEFSDSAWTFCVVPGGCPCVSRVATRSDPTDNVEAVSASLHDEGRADSTRHAAGRRFDFIRYATGARIVTRSAGLVRAKSPRACPQPVTHPATIAVVPAAGRASCELRRRSAAILPATSGAPR